MQKKIIPNRFVLQRQRQAILRARLVLRAQDAIEDAELLQEVANLLDELARIRSYVTH